MRLKRSWGFEQAAGGTRHRVMECRKRLRRVRVIQRALCLERDEAVVAATEMLALVPADAGLPAAVEVFEEAGARAARRFTPEVDRRARLRAR